MTDVYVWYLMRRRLEELRHEAGVRRRAARRGRRSEPARVGAAPCCEGAACCASSA